MCVLFHNACAIIYLSIVLASVQAHTWIDCIDHDYDVVYTNSDAWVYGGTSGRGLCEGYARGFPGQGSPDLSPGFTHLMDQAAVTAGTPVCQYGANDGLNYGGWRTRVSAKAGDRLYFAYFPNGHVSKDKQGRGTQYGIYWSDNAGADLELTTDLEGHLLDNKLFDFDDGNCGETFEDVAKTVRSDRAGDGKPCIGSFVVPEVSTAGVYQFIYMWTFYPTDEGHVIRDGFFGAAYSSCFDIEISTSSSSSSSPISEPAVPTSEPAVSTPAPTVAPSPTHNAVTPTPTPESATPTPTPESATPTPTPESATPTPTPESATPTPTPESATPTPTTHCAYTNAQLQCSPFWAPCYDNGVQYACTTGSTCIALNEHYSQCQPNEHPSDVQCSEVGEKCPVGWTCHQLAGHDSGHCAPSDKQCDNVSTQTEAVESFHEAETEVTNHLRAAVVETSAERESNLETTEASSSKRSTSTTSQAKSSVTVTSVGGSGVYGRVVNMNPGVFGQACPSNQCVQQDTPVAGSLAPFNDEVSVSFRGPLILSNVAVYEPSSTDDDDDWTQVSVYARDSPELDSNVVFLNNKGDGDTSGIWTSCGGNSQSFASPDASQVSRGPQHFRGELDGQTEVSIMSGDPCTSGSSSSSCGFSRGEAYHGWKGSSSGDKIFVIKAQMPDSGNPNHGNLPAIWMLHSSVLRTAQYGCNCRGMGSNGGCGEFDVAEVLPANPNVLTSTIYSFKGSRGTSGYAARPKDAPVTFVVIFDSAASGRMKVLVFDDDQVDFQDARLSRETVERWLEDPEVAEEQVTIDFDL